MNGHGATNGSPVWHPFTQHGMTEDTPLVERTEGALFHCRDGRSLIDGIASWWVITHGHSDPRIMAAVRAATEKLDQIIFAGFTHEAAEQVARGLIRLTDAHLPAPDPLTRVFFSDSGSTCVEVALKMALGYWYHRAAATADAPRHRIVVLEGSYHGDTIGTMSVGAPGVFNQVYTPLMFEVSRIPWPAPGREQRCFDALEALCRGPEKPAALILEPLALGSGGMLFYSPAALKTMADICARHDVLFIADEVMTAWGRTGTLFACAQAGVTPDILCTAKGLTGGSVPLAATLAKEAIFAAHLSDTRATMFYHSSSFTANPISCAAAAANLAIWEEEDMAAKLESVGARVQHHVDRLADHPAYENARRLGTLCAFDLRVPANAGYLSDVSPVLRGFFLERGLVLRPLGNTVYVMPPYCTSPAQFDALFDAIDEAGHRFGCR